jgi:CubicO group peptidase (beta-lactamase class C family)
VLGVPIARASGESLEGFLRERIFALLGMKDTRLASAYSANPATHALELFDDRRDSPSRARRSSS